MFGKLRIGRQHGFTLAEMSVALAVSAITLTALMAFTVYSSRTFAAFENYVDLEQKTQNALDVMTRDIRQAQSLSSFGSKTINGRLVTNVVTFVDGDGSSFTYHYTNPPSGDGANTVGVLMRTRNGASTMLLTNVDYLNFQLFQRNPVAGSVYDQHPASGAANCKLVAVSWICSRSILGNRINTESVQTTKIIMRKQ